MTSSQHGLYVLGYTHATGGYNGLRSREVELIPQSRSQFRLQAAPRLHETGVAITAGQHTAVNMFPGLVHTARHVMEAGNT